MLKGLNRKTAFGGSETVREKFTLVGEDGLYACVAPGAAEDATPKALAKLVSGVTISVSQKIDDQGPALTKRSTSDKAQAGSKYAPFIRHAGLMASGTVDESETADELEEANV